MFVYALVITSGLGALVGSAMILRRGLKRRSAAIMAFALLALAGASAFSYDLWAHRQLWDDDSTAIAVLNFVGILMIHSYGLLPTILGCTWLYFTQTPVAAPKPENDGAAES